MKPKILLIGWDAADWKVIKPLIAAGEMPHLKQLIENGVHGNLTTLQPPLSPMLWTSIATGKLPIDHGIHGFSEPTPDGLSVRPISSSSRKVKAIWNILNQEGWRSSVIGWWPSHPVEPINGVMVSNHFRDVPELLQKQKIKVPQQSVHPPEWEKRLDELRVAPAELDLSVLKFFCPDARLVDQEQDKSLHSLAKTVSETITIHNVAMEVLTGESWDFLAVYHDSLDHFSHRFMAYHPPRLPWVAEKDYSLYAPIVANAYRYHDAMLGIMLQHVDEATSVILISDHGFHSDHLRLQAPPVEPAGPAYEHNPYGIFVAKGPLIKKGEEVFGASLLNICPTLLALGNLPLARDMATNPLDSIFLEKPKHEYIDSWENRDGDSASLEPDRSFTTREFDDAVMQQMVDLGYIEPPDEDSQVSAKSSLREQKYNLARSLADCYRSAEAIEIIAPLWEENPKEHRFGKLLISLYMETEQYEERREAINRLKERADYYQKSSAERLSSEKEKFEKLKENDVFPEAQKLKYEWRKLVELANGIPNYLLSCELTQAIATGNTESAENILGELERIKNPSLPFCLLINNAYAKLKKWKKVLYWSKLCVDLDPSNFSALRWRSQAFYKLRDWHDASLSAVDSLALFYFQPRLHLLLGSCLWRMGKHNEAAIEFEVAIKQMPTLTEAYFNLSRIYSGPLNQPAKGAEYHLQGEVLKNLQRKAQSSEQDNQSNLTKTNEIVDSEFEIQNTQATVQNASNPVVVVSGLPRSGTSLMMQMLKAGGLSLVDDGKRTADDNNPNGYAEDVRVTRLHRDASWISEARNQAIKVVAPLLPSLPDSEHYLVLMMRRDIREIAASQKTMLERLNKLGAQRSPESMERALQSMLNRSLRAVVPRANFQFLDVPYADLVQAEPKLLKAIEAFLPQAFDVAKAKEAIDPKLYRTKL